MTATLTLTLSKVKNEPTQVLQLKQPTDVKGKLDLLLKEMKSSKLLSERLEIMLEVFSDDFHHKYDFQSEMDSHILENASMDLCFFDHTVIRKAIKEHGLNEKIQIQLLRFEDKL